MGVIVIIVVALLITGTITGLAAVLVAFAGLLTALAGVIAAAGKFKH
jgi:hypothetical protein